jgi:two-component system phosphate regulon sensor histidine kinase PhoR
LCQGFSIERAQGFASRAYSVQMRDAPFSMRWWLALAFAAIAALTALAVAQVFTARSESAIRDRAEDLVAGAAVAAAAQISPQATIASIREDAARFGESRNLALFAFARDGSLLTPRRARGVSVEELPNYEPLLATALAGRRRVETIDDGRVVTVALPLRRERTAALIGVASRSDLEDALGIVRDEIANAALWATAIGAFVGLVVAWLITRRLRRIAAAAAEIERGRFDRELKPRFPDELGALAGTIDRMRERLRTSFERLEGERHRLQRLLEQLQEGVIAVDRTLTVEFANSRARLLLNPDLTSGQPLPDPWPTPSLREAVRALFDASATPKTIRVHPEPERTYMVGLLPPGPAADAAVVVVTDVTTRERRERAEREFVMNAAHELRTPLSAISSAVEVLQQGAKDSEADRDRFLAIVERQTTRLTRLARALLTLAHAQTRSGAIRLDAVPVAPLVEELAAGLDDPSVTVDVCCDDVAVVAHTDLLRQALDNLTANALKHAGGQGLRLRVAHVPGDRVRIEVADRGPGMTRDDAEKALDRFYRAGAANGEGFGLGLSIAREVVRVLNGTLTIDSQLGEGTTVAIELESAAEGRECH